MRNSALLRFSPYPALSAKMSGTPLLPAKRPDPVLPSALRLPLFNKLRGKYVVLASGSPRRLDILRTYGLDPVVCPSTFPETLSHADFEDPAQYAVATGSAKALEVYEKLVSESPEDPPDLVIGADTVVILGGTNPAILEKPSSKGDQLDMLESYRGADVRVATGITLVQPQLATPGYSCTSLVVESKVVFAENSPELLDAYVECGEGIDRAGGFAIQGMGGLLVERIEGDYNNVVGFPGQAFFRWLGEMAEEGTLLEDN